jgi:hypothetical protein
MGDGLKRAAKAAKATQKPKQYLCTECAKDAFLGYTAGKDADWGGRVRPGERLCTSCFKKRGGESFF